MSANFAGILFAILMMVVSWKVLEFYRQQRNGEKVKTPEKLKIAEKSLKDSRLVKLLIIVGGVISMTMAAKVILGSNWLFGRLVFRLEYWACVVGFVDATLVMWLRGVTSWKIFQTFVVAPAIVVIFLFAVSEATGKEWSLTGYRKWQKERIKSTNQILSPEPIRWVVDGYIYYDLSSGENYADMFILPPNHGWTDWIIIPRNSKVEWECSWEKSFLVEYQGDKDVYLMSSGMPWRDEPFRFKEKFGRGTDVKMIIYAL